MDSLVSLLFPPKCVLCTALLPDGQTDLCHACRAKAPKFSKSRISIPFVAQWTAVWYYKGAVRSSILRYKFSGRRSYSAAYGRLLAMKLHTAPPGEFDILTWVPISAVRRFQRGYDQVELLAGTVASELGIRAQRTLRKIRHTKPQSAIPDPSARKANVLGAFRVLHPERIAGKRILLLDDIITTGATASEAAKVLRLAGAKQVYCAAIAASPDFRLQGAASTRNSR